MTSQHDVTTASSITVEELEEVSQSRVFFGHRSVGTNILDGVRAVYAAHGVAVPPIEEGIAEAVGDGGFIDHAHIGQNGNPMLKIQDFDRRMRSGIGQRVDVAMMKLCYIDVSSATDVGALFAEYARITGDLQREFADVAFVHATVPLTTGSGLLSKLKGQLTGRPSQGHNAARERLNAMLRDEYAGDGLFDLAAAESTAPDGTRAGRDFRGQHCDQLYDGYAADEGHLNGKGARVVATAWLKSVARARGK